MPRRNPKKAANGMWVADLRAYGGGRIQRRTQKAALALLHETRKAYEAGEMPAKRAPTLAEFIPQATAAIRPRVESATWKGYERNLRLHILPHIGSVALDRIDVACQQAFVLTLLDEKMTPANLQRVYSTLSVVLMHGARLKLCPVPSKQLLSMPRVPKPLIDAPTVAQVEAAAADVSAPFHALVILCGYCGLRQGEAFALRPGDVDFERHQIRVRESFKRDIRERGEPKSHQPRVVPMLGPVEDALRTHIAEGYATPTLVFHSNGREVNGRLFWRDVWTPMQERTGLAFDFRDLRHAAATIMAHLGGWGPKRVQLALGHASAGFTIDRYQHLWADDEVEARERLTDALRVAIEQSKREAVRNA